MSGLARAFTVGGLRCHTLEGGLQRLDGGAMFGVVPRPLWQTRIAPDERHRIPLAMRCLLVEHPEGLVLVDTGLGNKEDRKFLDIYGVENGGLEGASQLTLQAEGIFKHSHPGGQAEDRAGFYAFGDYRYHTRWNGGALFEQWQREGDTDRYDRGVRAFLGYAVLEESTLLRLAYERFLPDGGNAFDTVTLQLLFSMGPHKAHQF